MENTKDELKLLKALDLINEEDFLGAKKLFLEIIENNPQNIEAYKNLGLCEVNLDNPLDAASAFKKVVELDKDDMTSLFYLASCQNRIGQKEEASTNFERVIIARPEYIDAYKSLAMLYLEFSQIDSCIKIIQKALSNPSIEPDSSLYYIIATSYMLKKDFNNAITYLESGLKINPNHIQMLNSLSVCYMNVMRFDESLEVLNKAYETDKENSLTTYNLGVLYRTIKNYKKALEFFQISYNLEPTTTMLANLANCALMAEEYNLACVLYQNLVNAYPNNVQYRLSYIQTLDMTQQYQLALDNTEILLNLDEKDVDLIKKKGTYLRKLGQFEASSAVFDTLVKRGKIDVEVYYNLAFDYVEMGDFDNACEMFKKCIILEPNNPYAHKDLGVLYLKMNCYDWAVDEMLEAIKLEGDVSEFHYSLGVSYLMLSNIKEAKEAFYNAIKYDENYADAYSYLGYVFLLEKDFDKAFEALSKAIKISPDSFLAKMHLAKYYFQKQDYKNTKQLLIDILEQIKDDETLNTLGICYMETKEWEEASGIFSKLVAKYNKNHILLTNFAKCLYNLSKPKEALEYLRQALLIYDDYEPALLLLKEINNG